MEFAPALALYFMSAEMLARYLRYITGPAGNCLIEGVS
jgi:hypothetical protein